MSAQNNPFVLPGFGQEGDMASHPLLASMEMMRQAWAGLAGPGGLAQSMPMTPPLNLEDLDRRIAELRSVENWLKLNLSMLSSTIQGMEVQRATIATLKSFVGAATGTSDGEAPSPLEVALGIKPAPDRNDSGADSPAAGSSADEPGPGAAAAAAAQSATQAWWALLQQQFGQLAAATAASMAEAGASAAAAAQPAAPAAAPAPARKKPAAKRAAPRKRAAAKTPRNAS